MGRQNFTSGQEAVNQDFNNISARTEADIYDRLAFEILGRRKNAFFADSFSVSRISSGSLLIKKGLGFQEVLADDAEPNLKPVVRDEDYNQNIDTPDNSNDRIDLLCVKADRANSVNENRKFKSEFDDTVSTQQFTVATDWEAEINYVVGTPSGSPAVPATPAGYIAICEIYVSAAIGIVDADALTDKRNFLPVALGLSGTGNIEYDAIVGTVGVDQGATYNDLKSAVDNASEGWKILVVRNQQLDSTIALDTDNVEIVCKRGVSLIDNGAAVGIEVSGKDCRINNARFSGFTDKALNILAACEGLFLDVPRFAGCNETYADASNDLYINTEYVS